MPKDARLIINSMGKADLHIHTNFSDGITKPSDVLKLAKSRGLAVIAITDHNTIEGAQEVKKYEKESGVEVLNGFPWNFRRSSQLLSMNNEWKLAITGGSDSHGPRSLGCAYTLFEGNSSIDLRKALAHKTTAVHGHTMPMVEWIRTVGNDALYRSRKMFNSQSTRSSSSPH